ncbi:MAG: DUF2892 domain-containing protein [Firmicutes bacterium]|nr:DUF2892 domain-containing protein [Bacillota bacterium]
MTKNVGRVDAYVRLSGGLMLVAFGAAAMSRRINLGSVLAITLGSMKVAEGITRYDPMFDAMGISTRVQTPLEEVTDTAAVARDKAQEVTDRLAKKAEEYLS